MSESVVIVANGEYILSGSTSRIEDMRRYAVVVFWDSRTNEISFVIGDKSNEASGYEPGIGGNNPPLLAPGDDDVLYKNPILVCATPLGIEPPTSMCQIGNSLIITVFECGTFECYPITLPAAGQPLPDIANNLGWTVSSLGKFLAPLPKAWSFKPKVQGDLLVYTATNDGTGTPVFLTDPATGDHVVTRLDINADYWLSDNTPGATYNELVEPEWVYPSGDATGAPDDSDRTVHTGPGATSGEANQTNPLPGSANHSKSRAYGYQFVVAYTVTDSKGNKIQRFSKASPDLWIEDRIYKPATFGYIALEADMGAPAGKEAFTDEIGSASATENRWWSKGDTGPDWWFGTRNGGFGTANTVAPYLGSYETSVGGSAGAQTNPTFFPTADDFFALQTKFRGYGAGMTLDPYFFAATWLGWISTHKAWVKFPGACTPYKVKASASELLSAPQTVFNWDDFDLSSFVGGTPTEIRVYRTGHFGADDAANSDVDSLSEPHVYGYAGSIKPGQAFTDTVKDNALDTGDKPSDYDGFEVGQFSAQVAREFMTKLVLGNYKTSYWVDTPGPEVSANYGYYNGDTLLLPFTFPADQWLVPAGSGDALNLLSFHYAYVDELGNESALRDVTLNFDPLWGAHALGVYLVFPRGGDPFISGIHVWASRWDATLTPPARKYFDMGIIPVTQAMFSLPDLSGLLPGGNTAYTLARPAQTVQDSYNPNQGIYSIGNQPYNFPPLQVEQWHPYGAVLGMVAIFGDLLIITTDGCTWTTLTGGTVRVEENTKQVGGISRFGVCEWNKAAFFLSTNGVYVLEGDGVTPLAAQVSVAIRKYLNETIPGIPRHANAMRASMGVLGSRYEIWLHFPSSIDLWEEAAAKAGKNITVDTSKALPQTTFIYKWTTGQIRRQYQTGMFLGVENYQFDLVDQPTSFDGIGFELQNAPQPSGGTPPVSGTPQLLDITKFRPERVIFASHVDGSLWAAFHPRDALTAQLAPQGKSTIGALDLVNCDYPQVDWQGHAYAEKPFVLGMTTSSKQIRQIYLKMAVNAKIQLVHGVVKPDFAYDIVRGYINQKARIWDVVNPMPGRPNVLSSRGTNVALESKGVAPVVRVITSPDEDGLHRGEFQSLNLDLTLKHHHPR